MLLLLLLLLLWSYWSTGVRRGWSKERLFSCLLLPMLSCGVEVVPCRVLLLLSCSKQPLQVAVRSRMLLRYCSSLLVLLCCCTAVKGSILYAAACLQSKRCRTCMESVLFWMLLGVGWSGCCWCCTTTALAQQAQQGMALIIMLTNRLHHTIVALTEVRISTIV
jgi:hypothetical protein